MNKRQIKKRVKRAKINKERGMMREAEPREIDKFRLVDKGIMEYQAFLDKY